MISTLEIILITETRDGLESDDCICSIDNKPHHQSDIFISYINKQILLLLLELLFLQRSMNNNIKNPH